MSVYFVSKYLLTEKEKNIREFHKFCTKYKFMLLRNYRCPLTAMQAIIYSEIDKTFSVNRLNFKFRQLLRDVIVT